MRLRHALVEGAGSVGERARQRRWSALSQMFPDLSEMTVLDLGGTVRSWVHAPVRPARVQIVNVAPDADDVCSWITVADGDACDPPPSILSAAYDLVYSNSVIEHVGGHHRRRQFAAVVESAADRFWVQTPYRYFPLEPHWLLPGLQHLPVLVRAHLTLRWPLTHTRAPTLDRSIAAQLATELLDITQMRFYFPRAEIELERMAGVPKSIIAART